MNAPDGGDRIRGKDRKNDISVDNFHNPLLDADQRLNLLKNKVGER